MNDTRKPRQGNRGYSAKFTDSADFARTTIQHTWLIDRILVKGQPGVIGGPKKSLKTSIGIDMAISLGTGTPFLGEFEVPEKMRVGFLSGESGEATVRETAQRICKAKKVRLKTADVSWSFRLPCLSRKLDLVGLKDELCEHQVKVVIIDPLYLCLLGGARNISASNLYEIGPLLWRVGKACRAAGATPILIHHTTKEAEKKSEQRAGPLNLDDLAFSGIGEFVRQWLLINRRWQYEHATGNHHLLMAVGGSAGHSGCWEVDVQEGVLRNDFSDREWSATVRKYNGSCAAKATGPQTSGNRVRHGSFDEDPNF